MSEIDELSTLVFEQAKRFLEKANEADDDEDRDANLNAALLLGFCALEGHVNSVAAELALRPGLELLELSLLMENDVKFKAGEFKLTDTLKMFRFEDRLEFVFRRFTKINLPKGEAWWGDLRNGIKLRNELVHPKAGLKLKISDVERSLSAVLDCFNCLYRALFKKNYPSFGRGLTSKLTF
jgi:hypothetical protein